jgi:hypothetical protein
MDPPETRAASSEEGLTEPPEIEIARVAADFSEFARAQEQRAVALDLFEVPDEEGSVLAQPSQDRLIVYTDAADDIGHEHYVMACGDFHERIRIIVISARGKEGGLAPAHDVGSVEYRRRIAECIDVAAEQRPA